MKRISITILLVLIYAFPAGAQELSRPLEQIGNHMDDPEFWNILTKLLPNGEYLVVGGAWLDVAHTKIISIVFKEPKTLFYIDEFTNAYLAIFDKENGHYQLRQFTELWDSQRDYNKRERLSLPMHHYWLDSQWDGRPKYSYAELSAIDIDADHTQDILIELLYAGGSYASYEVFVLHNQDDNYHVVLSKKAGSGVEYDSFYGVKRINDFNHDQIPEIVIWDEIYSDGVAHCDCRSWADIYHWNGTTMEQSNARYPAFYTKHIKPGFLEICQEYYPKPKMWHPEGNIPEYWGFMDVRTGCLHEHTYYLGLIAEYEGNIPQAQEYYKYFLRPDPSTFADSYRQAAESRMRQIQQKK